MSESDKRPLGSGKQKQRRRFNEPGHAHSLTFCCFRRQPFLTGERARQWTTEAIDKARRTHDFHVWAYVIMPEHVHLLVCPTTLDYNISQFLSSLKGSVAKRAVLFVQSQAPEFLPRMTDLQPNGACSYRFWQRGGGYDRNVWEPQYIWETIDYIHANPVRRGLCQRPEEWPWSSARAHLGLGHDALTVDRESLPEDPPSATTQAMIARRLIAPSTTCPRRRGHATRAMDPTLPSWMHHAASTRRGTARPASSLTSLASS
jgi:putative transposase